MRMFASGFLLPSSNFPPSPRRPQGKEEGGSAVNPAFPRMCVCVTILLIRVCARTCECIYMYVCVCLCECGYVWMCIGVYICMYSCDCESMCVYACVFTCRFLEMSRSEKVHGHWFKGLNSRYFLSYF